MGYVDFDDFSAKVRDQIATDLTEHLTDLLKQTRFSSAEAQLWDTQLKSHLKGLDNKLAENGYLNVLNRAPDSLYTDKPGDLVNWADEANPATYYDANVMKKAAYRGVLLEVVALQQKNPS